MNMLQIIHNAQIGGAEVHTRLITRAFARMGYRITFIYGPGPYASQYASLADTGVECIEFDMKKNLIDSIRFIRRILKEKKIDIIHSHMHGADFIASIARIGLGIRHFTTIHCIPQKVKGLVFKIRIVLATFISYHLMEKIFAVSKTAGEQMRRDMMLPGRKIVVVFNSIDFKEMETHPAAVGELKRKLKPFDDSRLIICTGNLYWVKGFRYVIDAMQQLRETHPHLRLVFIGKGDDEDELRGQVGRSGLEDRIVFAGYQTNVPDWLSAADIYCQPSLVDAMPRALLEAMFMGLPVVVSDIKNLLEAVRDRENGLVVPVQSSEALAKAIHFLLENPGEALRMGKSARQFVLENCSMDTMAERICASMGISP